MPVYDHTAILPSEYVEAFRKFIESGHQCGGEGSQSMLEKIDEILISFDTTIAYSLEVNLLDLLDFNQQLGTLLIHQPEQLMPLFADALSAIQQHQIKTSEDRYSMILKPCVFPRLVVPPTCESVCKPNVSSIRSSDVGSLVSVRGTVIRTGLIKMLESQREYECSKCKHTFKVFADLHQQNSSLAAPSACPSVGAKTCRSTSFTIIEGTRVCRDYQEIKIQEEVRCRILQQQDAVLFEAGKQQPRMLI